MTRFIVNVFVDGDLDRVECEIERSVSSQGLSYFVGCLTYPEIYPFYWFGVSAIDAMERMKSKVESYVVNTLGAPSSLTWVLLGENADGR